jgi:Aspartyl/Asparaginyl beta-hydroxylase
MTLSMKHFERIASGIDTSQIRGVLERWPQLMSGQSLPWDAPWDALEMEANTRVGINQFGNEAPRWDVLWLRWPVDEDPWDCMEFRPDVSETVDWARETLSTIAHCIGGVEEIGHIQVSRLRAGASIRPHIDEGLYAERFSRFHLVLTSNPRCLFTSGGETVHMAPGELWWLDQGVLHSVTNGGPDRDHFVFDAAVPDR